jgi:P-type Cu2+ transporter
MLQKVQASRVDCFHCGQPVAGGEQFCVELSGQLRHFCCPACRAVACTIVDSGLSSFYQHRDISAAAGIDSQTPAAELAHENFSAFDDSEFQQRYVNRQTINGEQLATAQLLIGGIHCAACIWLLEKYLLKLVGVKRVSVSLTEQKLNLSWRAESVSLSAICRAIAALGYQPEPYSDNHLQELQQRENHQALRRLGVAGIGMMQVAMFAIALYAGDLQSMAQEYRDFIRAVSLIVATPVVFYSARPFFTGAWRGLKMKKPGMDLPVATAIGLAYAASIKATLLGVGDVYFDSVTMFTFLLLTGRYLEMRARHYAGRRSGDLASLLPAIAQRIFANGDSVSIALFKIKVGDKLMVRPGQVIPADGLVVEGSIGVDESQMTGEFALQDKVVGDVLVAGTVNGDGVLFMQVQATGVDLQLQSINRLLLQARSEKPQLAQLADKFASYFVLLVLVLAALSYCYWYFFAGAEYSQQAFWISLSVLVVSCPCALSLATPVALTAATSRLRDLGLLVTRPHVWELIPVISDVVCDKTGTLTKGELSIADIKPVVLNSQLDFLAIAAAIEGFSEHPIAQAFVNSSAGGEQGLVVSNVQADIGEGVQAEVDGQPYRLGRSNYAAALYGSSDQALAADCQPGQWVLLSGNSGPLCWFRLEDSLRDDAALVVASLQQQGLKVHILSGDNSMVVQQLGEKLAVDYCVAGASPQDKLDYIRRLQESGARVLMLGDGINDVPVLAAADISVAMASASDLAKTNADSILLSGRLSSVLTLIKLAVATRLTIRQNIAWALAYNLLAIPLAAMAMIAPYVAAIGMSFSSLVVVLNALRLQRVASVSIDAPKPHVLKPVALTGQPS